MLHLGSRRLYFLHIPKTAGSSITDWLTQCVGPTGTCPAKTWDQLVELGTSDLLKYRLFTGHFGWGFDAVIGRPLHVFTVFRDPLERTISHYRHVHRAEDHPRHKVVVRQTFSEFVADEDNWPMIENFQARYLIKNVIDPTQIFGRLDRDVTKRNRLSTAAEECRFLFDKGYVRETATRHFKDLDVIGVTDKLDSFLARLASRFRFLNAPPTATRSNVSPRDGLSITVDDCSRKTVSKLTQIDQDLFERARTLS